ncbi:hypothetical protein CXB51_013783 [Gossypium anomalum]|uniref:Uncharacterized protein n=1 Tax=Gossypium anomalum TaxID=47600 RepID=A0A8J5YJP9_9ROSI|nr:hypothetical protein CXB51_013783 [Gossypium anomalum]
MEYRTPHLLTFIPSSYNEIHRQILHYKKKFSMAGIFSVSTSQKTLCPPKAETPALTPFSAVVPARFIAVPRLHNTHIILETIHEEENEGEISMEVPSSSSPSSFLSTCFFQVKKPLPSFSHNCKCA